MDFVAVGIRADEIAEAIGGRAGNHGVAHRGKPGRERRVLHGGGHAKQQRDDDDGAYGATGGGASASHHADACFQARVAESVGHARKCRPYGIAQQKKLVLAGVVALGEDFGVDLIFVYILNLAHEHVCSRVEPVEHHGALRYGQVDPVAMAQVAFLMLDNHVQVGRGSAFGHNDIPPPAEWRDVVFLREYYRVAARRLFAACTDYPGYGQGRAQRCDGGHGHAGEIDQGHGLGPHGHGRLRQRIHFGAHGRYLRLSRFCGFFRFRRYHGHDYERQCDSAHEHGPVEAVESGRRERQSVKDRERRQQKRHLQGILCERSHYLFFSIMSMSSRNSSAEISSLRVSVDTRLNVEPPKKRLIMLLSDCSR